MFANGSIIIMTRIFRNGVFLFLLLSFVSAKVQAQADFVFADASKPDSFAIPFQIRDSLIRVTARVNGKQADFVLDNGCPYLVINSRYWQTAIQKDSSVRARGIGGEVIAGAVLIDSFNWQGLQKYRFKAIAADLPHLGDSICGLMGFDVYKDYRVYFNYKDSIIVFKKPVLNSAVADSSALPVIMPFVLSGHLPVVKGSIEGQTVVMGIDCAATPNLIAAKWLSKIKGITPMGTTLLRGGGAPVLVTWGSITQFFIEGVLYPGMNFTFDDKSLSEINRGSNIAIDGLLGIPFFKQYKTVIDFPNKRIEVYDK